MVDLFITIGLSLLFLFTILGTKSIFVGLIVLTVVFFGIFFFIRTPASFLFLARNIVRGYLWEKHRYRIISASILGMVFLTPALGFPATAVLMCSIVGLVLHWQSAVFFGIAGGFLLAAPFFLSVREEALAESVALLSYYFLCLGVVWEGISQVVHAVFPNVSFRFAKPRVPHISLPTLPTIVVEVPDPHISLPTIVVEKPHISVPSFSFKVPRVPTIHHAQRALPTNVMTEPVAISQRRTSLYDRLKFFMELFLDMTDMSRLYRYIPGYRTAQQLHMALSRPLFTFSIPTRQSMYGMIKKGKKQISLLWKKLEVPVSVISAQSGEQLTLSFSPREPSELSIPTQPIPVVATVQKTVQSETPSPPIARSMSGLSPRSNHFRMVTVETEDIGPMVHLPHIAMPNMSFPTWDEWKQLLYRWQKTKLIWPSFRIRFILPTVMLPTIRLKSNPSIPYASAMSSTQEDPAFAHAYRRVQMKNKIPRFQVKIKLPHAFHWPSVFAPKTHVHAPTHTKKKSAPHLPVVRVKVSAPSYVMQIQKTAVQNMKVMKMSLKQSRDTIVRIPGKICQAIGDAIVQTKTQILSGYRVIRHRIAGVYHALRTMVMESVRFVRQIYESVIAQVYHGVEMIASLMKSIYQFVCRLNQTWSYTFRIVLPIPKSKKQKSEIHVLEDMFALLPSVASEKSIPSLNLFQSRVLFFERVEDMLATLPVCAPSDRIPSVNLFTKKSKQFLPYSVMTFSPSLTSWMIYAILGSAFLCGIFFNILR